MTLSLNLNQSSRNGFVGTAETLLCFFDDSRSFRNAFSATASKAELLLQIEDCGPAARGGLDLAIGDGGTDADVHAPNQY